MSEMPPIGLATTYLLLLPVPSPNCTVYSYLPFCTRTYSQAAIWHQLFLPGLPQTRPAQSVKPFVGALVGELPLVPGNGNNLQDRPV
jgi:hypothetical protein